MDIFPDSGATICLAGPQHLNEMGLQIKHLIKCKKVVGAVGGFKMTCTGWIPVEFYIGMGDRLPSKPYIYATTLTGYISVELHVKLLA